MIGNKLAIREFKHIEYNPCTVGRALVRVQQILQNEVSAAEISRKESKCQMLTMLKKQLLYLKNEPGFIVNVFNTLNSNLNS